MLLFLGTAGGVLVLHGVVLLLSLFVDFRIAALLLIVNAPVIPLVTWLTDTFPFLEDTGLLLVIATSSLFWATIVVLVADLWPLLRWAKRMLS